MYVIGTAGHVDHGKSTLVEAITGIDPDRLQEEKDRGMTIDLGFAWLTLPSGQEVSVVDVPGHERFVKNMLAGVGGIDLALLLVAADEGVMPQTREHLAILDLLGVQRGVIVLTKKDLVDDEWLDLVTAEVEEVLTDTTLAQAPLVSVSGLTKEGLPLLLQTLDDLLAETPPKRDTGRPRLPIDRVFTIAGFGTIATGTLIDGSFTLGQEIEVQPQGLRSRIRGLQTHRQKVEVALPGTRVAANLAGLATDQLTRGDVVTSSDWLRPTMTVDARLRLLADVPSRLPHNAIRTLHTLASETLTKVRLLDGAELLPGQTGWVQLRLQRPLAICKGDSFILRSSSGTIGGGVVVDPYPKRHRRFHEETLTTLHAMEQGSPATVLLQSLEKRGPVEVSTLLKTAPFSQSDGQEAVETLVAQGEAVVLGGRRPAAGALMVSASVWRRVSETARQALSDYHRQHPLRSGMSKEELRTRLRLPPRAAAEALDLLLHEETLRENGPTVRLPEHHVQLSPAQEAQALELIKALEKDPYSPPSDLQMDSEIVSVLVEQRRVVRVTEGIFYSAPVYDAMAAKVTAYLQEHRKITVAEVRDMFSNSRKYALALMEHLDQQHVTRRVGDERVLR